MTKSGVTVSLKEQLLAVEALREGGASVVSFGEEGLLAHVSFPERRPEAVESPVAQPEDVESLIARIKSGGFNGLSPELQEKLADEAHNLRNERSELESDEQIAARKEHETMLYSHAD